MKELSLEEKAKRYDEAIAVINKSETDKYGCIIGIKPSDIFPEFKESNDEKVKRILHSISNKISSNLRDIFTEEEFQCFDTWTNVWLEKQDEQKPETIFLKFRIGDKVTNGVDIYTINFIGKDRYCVKEHDCVTIPFEYQHNWKLIEQNHTDKVEPKFRVGQTIKKEGFNLGFTIVKIKDGFYFNYMGDHFPFTDQDNWELVEQESAWSEEDKNILKWIFSHLETGDGVILDKATNWLEFLKYRVQPQKKQEWSEEDEQIFNVIKSELEKYIMLKQYGTPLSVHDIWWFEALKDRLQL